MLRSLDKDKVVRTIPCNMPEETKPSKIVRPVPSLDDVTRDWLKTKLKAIEDITEKDVLTICGYIVPSVDVSVRMAIEGLREKTETLLVLLDTPGGIVEEVRNIVQVMRYHYKYVHFLVPVYAMSAGTVLVMSGDKIYMDYFSRLGPIDPQIQINSGERIVPALSYLRQFERLIEKSKKESLTTPELALVNKLDLAELHQLQLAADLSASLIEDWLIKYKFKNLLRNGEPATKRYKAGLAESIAKDLSDHEKWYTHGNSIHKDVLEKEMGLEIDDYSTEEGLKEAVWEYFWSMLEYVNKHRFRSFVQSRELI